MKKPHRPQAPLRGLHPQVERGGARAGVQLPRRPARGLRGLRRQPAGRGLGAGPRPLRRWRLLRRHAGAAGAEAAARRHRGRAGRRRRRLQDRPAVPLADGLRQAGRGVRPRTASPSSRVTQSFNTTTSMGRLTLNILLSFAQFEREVIGERIRDKFAASRRKGMWMGGFVPLGYDVKDRKLVVDEAEAAIVRVDLRALRPDRLGDHAGAGAAARGRPHQARQARRQGLPLQAAQQPGLPRRGGAQGHGLSRRARRRSSARTLWDKVHAILRRTPARARRTPGRRRRRC